MVKYAGKDPDAKHPFNKGMFVIIKHHPTQDDDNQTEGVYVGLIGSVIFTYSEISTSRRNSSHVQILINRDLTPKNIIENQIGNASTLTIRAWTLEIYHQLDDTDKKLTKLLTELRDKTSSQSTYNDVTELLTQLGVEGLEKITPPKY